MAVAVMEKYMRLDKFLAEMGMGTRSQIKEMAKRGRIQVNGVTVDRADGKVEPDRDTVVCGGVKVAYAEYEYYMLNKPRGVVSATEDNLHETVIDLIRKKPAKQGAVGEAALQGGREGQRKRKGLFPVGRLDIDTEGLLLITNDGDLAHRLLSPKRHVDKRYFARVAGALPEDAGKRLKEGITLLDGTKVMPAKLEIGEGGQGEHAAARGMAGRGDVWVNVLGGKAQEEIREPVTEVVLTIQQGKFHQVKRMFEALGCRVVFLKRLSMGSLRLDEGLEPGEYRPLLAEELERLKGW